ncbi:DUF3060 domain-containing protein [Tahibacter sp.]|uniref:DUF3060 domain-containing protein n=1 Tax=Tahibacter sp. TaxID=2056211 RepID=UPI002D804D7F|nr:DUF3060 domain-containing protein [Tahibacter sp.]
MPARAGTLTDPATGATCTDRQDVLITRDDFRLVLDGVCGKVTIRASKGSLNVDEVTSIQVVGSGVTVLNQKVGTLTVEGSNNMLNMTEVGEAIVAGDNNTLLGDAYGRVHFRGKNNTVNSSNKPETVDEGSGNRVM